MRTAPAGSPLQLVFERAGRSRRRERVAGNLQESVDAEITKEIALNGLPLSVMYDF